MFRNIIAEIILSNRLIEGESLSLGNVYLEDPPKEGDIIALEEEYVVRKVTTVHKRSLTKDGSLSENLYYTTVRIYVS